MGKSKCFYMSLRTQYENLGDYLIAQATIDLLSKLADVVIDIRGVPRKFIDLFTFPKNVKLVRKNFFITVLYNRNIDWFYIVKPGGYGETKTFQNKIRLITKMTYFFITKKLFGIEVFRMPHSFTGNLNLIDKYYQNVFELNLCRDWTTYNLYKENAVKNLYMISDLAMFYYNKKSKFLFLEDKKQLDIVISLRYDRLNREPELASKLANILVNSDETIVYLSQVTFDRKLNQTEAINYNLRYVDYKIDIMSFENILKQYKSAKYVISNRLHVLILAMINGTVPIPLLDIRLDKKLIGSFELLNILWIDKDELNLEEKVFKIAKYNQNSLLHLQQHATILEKQFMDVIMNAIKKDL
jgi:hypothetical protein